ncbi:MAG: AMP-binding protein [Hydrogenophaga sp.]|uniref:AMP-binding protein n=1 Tax=Hydrogenophaga sp. TaxID=1904254 RepID=UPI0027319F36|nr:AMP-binding protein [Hydrogenophaga sp.]MDP2164729.1 AMP-binding protein [Hydrogenophaga sp.]MDP3475506.1 AMP-binding protein [Hydrogenophaga sp.]
MNESPARPWHASYQQVGIAQTLEQLPFRNLAELAFESCKKWQTESQVKAAFSCVVPNGMNGRLSFAQVNEASDAFAGYLRGVLKLEAGARVAVQLPNSLGYPVAALGVFKAGCVLVNTNPLYTETEMVYQFNNAGAQVLVMVDMFADKLPGVLAKTGIKQVVLASVSEFFPAIPGAIVRGVQRYWNRVLPPVTVPHVRLKDALARGRATLAQTPARTYWQDVGRDDLALLQYTGGTTGVSKGAMLTHGNLLSNIQQTRAMGQSHMAPGQECVLTALPLYHIFAFTTNLLGFLAIGGHNVLIPNPRPVQSLQRAMENFPITWMTGVNTLFNGLLNEEWFVAFPPKTLKASISGGTALHTAVAQRWRELTKTPIAEGYGLTETSPVVSFNPLAGTPRDGSIGIPAPGTDVRLVNDAGQDVPPGAPGEIWVRGPQVMLGYWNAEEETAKVMNNGWFATGDVAVMDETGFMRIVDRKKDMILVSGFNVYPNEVEDVIADMDHVLEVAVIGVPDEKTGEAVRAYVVQNPEHTKEVMPADVIAHCKQHLAAYKVPRLVVVRDDLPKSPIGKVLRKDLRQDVAKELNRS